MGYYNFEQDPEYQALLKQYSAPPRSERAAPAQAIPIPAATPPAPTPRDDFSAIYKMLEAQRQAPPTSRTLGETLGDTALSLGRGATGAVEGLAGLAGLVPGLNAVADPIRETASEASDWMRQQMSPIAQQNLADLQQAMQEGEYGNAALTALRPSNVVEGLGQLAGSVLGAKGLDKLGRAAGLYSKLGIPTQFTATQAMTPEMAKALALRAGISEGAFATGAIAGGIDQYQSQQGNEGWQPERLYAIPAGVLTGAIGGASARWLPDMDVAALAGRQAAAAMVRNGANPSTLLGRIGVSALKEGLVEEFPQSLGEGFFQALGTTGDPQGDQILAESIVSAIYGGLGGGGFGAFNNPPLPNTAPGQFDSWTQPPGGALNPLAAMNPPDAAQRANLIAALQQRPLRLQPVVGPETPAAPTPAAAVTPVPDYLDREYEAITQREFAAPPTPPQPGGLPLGPGASQEEDAAFRSMLVTTDVEALSALGERFDYLESVKQDAAAAIKEAIGWEQFLKPRGAAISPEYTSYMQRLEMLRNAQSMATAEQQRVTEEIANIQKNLGAAPTPPSARTANLEDPRLQARNQGIWRLQGRIAETKRELAAHKAQLNDPAHYDLLAAAGAAEAADWYKAKRAELEKRISEDQSALTALERRGPKKPALQPPPDGFTGPMRPPPDGFTGPLQPAPAAAVTPPRYSSKDNARDSVLEKHNAYLANPTEANKAAFDDELAAARAFYEIKRNSRSVLADTLRSYEKAVAAVPVVPAPAAAVTPTAPTPAEPAPAGAAPEAGAAPAAKVRPITTKDNAVQFLTEDLDIVKSQQGAEREQGLAVLENYATNTERRLKIGKKPRGAAEKAVRAKLNEVRNFIASERARQPANPPQPGLQEVTPVTGQQEVTPGAENGSRLLGQPSTETPTSEPKAGQEAETPSPTAPKSLMESSTPTTGATEPTTQEPKTTGQTKAASISEKAGSTSPTEDSSAQPSISEEAASGEISVADSPSIPTTAEQRTLSAYLSGKEMPADGAALPAEVPQLLNDIATEAKAADELARGLYLGKAKVEKEGVFITKKDLALGAADEAWFDIVGQEFYDAYKKLSTYFAELEKVMGDGDSKKGKETIDRAQQHNKKNYLENDRQTQEALLFSRFYRLFKEGLLTPDSVASATIRPPNANQVIYKLGEKAVAEHAGIPTDRTEFGRVLTGRTLPLPKARKDGTAAESQRTKLLEIVEKWLANRPAKDVLPYATAAEKDNDVTQHAAVAFFLKHVMAKEINPFTKLLADALYNVLDKNDGLYDIKVAYYPGLMNAPGRQGASSRASYDPTTNTINVYGAAVKTSNMLHEILHAATLAYVVNNPKAPSVRALYAIGNDLAETILAVKDTFMRAGRADIVALAEDYIRNKAEGNIERQLSEFISLAFTDIGVNNLMKRKAMSPTASKAVADLKTAYDRSSAFNKARAGLEKLKTLFSGFVKAISAIFKAGNKQFSESQLAGFLDAFNNLLIDISAAKTQIITDTNGKAKVPDVFKQKDIKSVLYSTEAVYAKGDAIEARLVEAEHKKEADLRRAREERVKAATIAAQGTTPQTQRDVTAATTAVTTVSNLQALKERVDAYHRVDALGKFLLSFLPNKIATKERQENLRDALYSYFSKHPKMGRVAENVFDKFMLPANVVSNMHNKNAAINYIDNLANLIVQDTPLSELESLQQQGWDYLKDPKKVPKDWRIAHLIDAFNDVINEAREAELIDPALKNAPNAEIITWLADKRYPYLRGYRYGQAGKELFSRHNGEEVTVTGYLLGSDGSTSPVYNAWVKEETIDGELKIDKQFVNAKLPIETQRSLIEDKYGDGYEPTSHNYYMIRENTLFRFKTPEENKKVAGSTYLLRSIAATAQEFQHALAGDKFSNEFIAENNAIPNIADKQAVLANEENITALKGLYGENRVVEYEKARGKDDKALLRTPGTWVILKGRKWGRLDDYIIPGQIYAALDDLNRNEPFINSKTFRTLNRWWKNNMTVYSLTASVNNVLSSFIWSYYHDIPPENIKWALEVIYYTKYKPDQAKLEHIAALKEASKMGALFGTLSISEDLGGLMEEQMRALGDTTDSRTGHFQTAAAMAGPILSKAREKGANFHKHASDFYANQDNVFRLAAYRTYVEQMAVNKGGKLTQADLELAGKKAADSMINYDINAKWINNMRQSLWPFLAWPYRALPMLAKIAVEKPWKLVNTLAAISVLNAISYALMGNAEPDDDKEKRERDLLPPYMRSSIWGLNITPGFARLPSTDPLKGAFLGLNRAVPLGDVAVINEGAVVPQTITPGGPLVLALQALGGYDWFKQERLREEGNTWGDNMKNTLEFVFRGAAPRSFSQAMDTWDKLVNDKRGPLGSQANAAIEIAKLLGFSVREVDFAESAYALSKAEQAKLQKVKASMRKAVNNELRYGIPDFDAISDIYDTYNSAYMNIIEEGI